MNQVTFSIIDQKESLPADDSDSFSFGVEVFTLPHTVPVTL